MQDFHKLKVWQRAHRLTLALYRLTKKFPKEELYGLTAQIRRAACSLKDVGEKVTESLGGSCISRWGQRVNWRIIFYCRPISSIWTAEYISISIERWLK